MQKLGKLVLQRVRGDEGKFSDEQGNSGSENQSNQQWPHDIHIQNIGIVGNKDNQLSSILQQNSNGNNKDSSGFASRHREALEYIKYKQGQRALSQQGGDSMQNNNSGYMQGQRALSQRRGDSMQHRNSSGASGNDEILLDIKRMRRVNTENNKQLSNNSSPNGRDSSSIPHLIQQPQELIARVLSNGQIQQSSDSFQDIEKFKEDLIGTFFILYEGTDENILRDMAIDIFNSLPEYKKKCVDEELIEYIYSIYGKDDKPLTQAMDVNLGQQFQSNRNLLQEQEVQQQKPKKSSFHQLFQDNQYKQKQGQGLSQGEILNKEPHKLYQESSFRQQYQRQQNLQKQGQRALNKQEQEEQNKEPRSPYGFKKKEINKKESCWRSCFGK